VEAIKRGAGTAEGEEGGTEVIGERGVGWGLSRVKVGCEVGGRGGGGEMGGGR